MNAWAARHPAVPSLASRTNARRGVSRGRRRLAASLQTLLDPRRRAWYGLGAWPRFPQANREALAEPLRELVVLLRDPAISIPEHALARVLALATHPSSPAYGRHPRQAGFAARSLVYELRQCAREDGAGMAAW